MRIFFLFFNSFFIFISSLNIIRDISYNIYHIEDMNQYQGKYIPEGNKFYIRFSSNIRSDIKFYLTIPKNISLFPIYLSDFSKYPSDEEIIGTNF